MQPASPRQIFLALFAGGAALVVVHALGRFAFTPLLPHFLADQLFSLEQGAQLASWNYLGYLLGALLALPLYTPARLRLALPLALLLNALLTLAQGFCDDILLLQGLRLANGISNGVVFVLAPALVLEWLAARQRASLSGLVYLGFAAGLSLAGWLADAPASWLHGPERWWPMAAIALPLALLSAWLLSRLQLHQRHSAPVANRSRLFDRASTPLFLAYAGAGLGYILPMTFLPTLAQEQLPPGHSLISGAWRWTALACLISIPLWNALGARFGDRHALLATYLLQAVGCAAPWLFPSAGGVLLCAVLVGGSFMGSVLLTQRLARTLQPHQGPRLSAALIALYGGAQLAGPWLAGMWLTFGGSLTQSFALGVAAMLWALAWTWYTPTANPTSGAPHP
ncbi:YbfB/YjiJ family MFS transporter [Pseudomonas sp. GWSMS-1]|uniref:YbfB/YjiJ family MFS transporter n=1 Tax=Pseudomonas sp. GWSMS-1 TaxID=3308997 RepID=UPI001D3FE113|nr:YbfB/YjiJ family MFS transporter [Gammaproteobacteria bacterium]MBU0882184.1 YbfB/YjiJ family MFS transporter [Gammaproteobacteria bacterium]MBU1860176.1 YbfB/YjiJ family MFS transporter [Gammaproteobacteria bacterium]